MSLAQVYSIPILLDGGVITKNSFAEFVEKILKYLLYDRSQIPYPFERINDIHKKDFTSLTTSSITTGSLAKSRNIQQITEFVKNIDNLIDCFTQIMMKEMLDIRSVAIAFGANLLVCKEVYLIEMPSDYDWKFKHSNDCTKLSTRECLTKFFHVILSSSIDDILKKRPEMRITRVSLLMITAEPKHKVMSSIQTTFKIKMNILTNYTLPVRAKVYKICPSLSKCSCFDSSFTKNFIIFRDFSCTEDELNSELNESVRNEGTNLKWIQIGETLACVDYYLNKIKQK